ncbi:NAD-dependent histone deacetylase sir2 [Podila humilis]|nr:NAD-dependent histone deacetylase sir2 [Podila humilis]
MEPLPPHQHQDTVHKLGQSSVQETTQVQHQQQHQPQQSLPENHHRPLSESSSADDLDRGLLAPTDQSLFSIPSRSESPVSRKRTEDETLANDLTGRQDPRQDGSNHNPHPPQKRSKMSPPSTPVATGTSLPPAEHSLLLSSSASSSNTSLHTSAQAIVEPAPVAPPSIIEGPLSMSTVTQCYSPPGGTQFKEIQMEGIRSTSQFQGQESPEAKSVENEEGHAIEVTVASRIEGDSTQRIQSQSLSRHSSPQPSIRHVSLRTVAKHLEDATTTFDHHSASDTDNNGEDDFENKFEDVHVYTSGLDYSSDSDFNYDDDDFLDEIDVENIAMHDSDAQDELPYEDTDPECLDRLTDIEAEEILDEARMHGIAYVVRKYILTHIHSAKKMLLLTTPGPIEMNEECTESDLIRAFSSHIKRMLRRRRRLSHVHTLEAVIALLKNSKKIMILTGAGVSVSCGIPDFRSPNGIYSRLSEFELDEPQQMFDLEFFRERPEIFYSFAREIFPSNFTPSPSHYFIKLIEDQGRLLRNYTQNIDTLEQKTGIHNVLQCHGSFATASCIRCGHQVQGDEIKDSIFKQEVAYCRVCRTPSPPPKAKRANKKRYSSDDEDESDDEDDTRIKGLMKPDIVFFGEKLPNVFDKSLEEDREEVDLLIVMGSSLKVAPVSDIMCSLPNSVPQILINKTPITHIDFDVQLLGNCDTIVAELCRMCGWELKHEKLPGGTSDVPNMDANDNMDGSGRGRRARWTHIEPNTYAFEGASLEDVTYTAEHANDATYLSDFQLPQESPSEQMSDDEAAEGNDEEATSEHVRLEHGLLGASKKRGRNEPDENRVDASVLGSSHMDEDIVWRHGDKMNRLNSAEPMSEDSTEFTRDQFVAGFDHLATTRAVPLGSVSSRDHTPSKLKSPTLVPVSSGFKSPLLQQTHIASVGVAAGSTEPRSGSITGIHQDGSKSDSLSPSLQPSASSSWHGAHGREDDIQVSGKLHLYNEKMPKGLGEEEETQAEDASEISDEVSSELAGDHTRYLNHAPHRGVGLHTLGLPTLHRRLSVELVPIAEDAQPEQDNGVGKGKEQMNDKS